MDLFGRPVAIDHDYPVGLPPRDLAIGVCDPPLELETFGLEVMSGKGTFLLWRSFYLSEQFSLRTKCLLLFDWFKAKGFGRDVSRY